MACEEWVTINRLKRGYVVESRNRCGAGTWERAYETIEAAVQSAVLLLGDGSFHGYPAGTRVEMRIVKPDDGADK